MRIVGGTLKGRKLNSWKGKPYLRPMTARIKETVFNVLTPYLFDGHLFLDLFSGTGNLALEALSRGAGQAHAVEQHPLSLRIIKKNSQILPEPEKLILHKKNVFSFLKKFQKNYKQKTEIKPFDLIIADPPFALQAGEKIIKGLQKSFLVKKGAVAVIETGHAEELKKHYFDFYLFSKKEFNDKKVWFYECR